jgi:hypothetical protein
MFTTFEKTVTLIGTIVSVITFILSFLNWIGMSIMVDTSIPNKRIAMTALIAFVFFASYAGATLVYATSIAGKPVLITWFLAVFSFVFGFLFLLDKSMQVMILDPEGVRSICTMAAGFNTLIFVALYFYRKLYPQGFTVGAWISRSFAAFGYGLGMFGHLLAVNLLFDLLAAK